MEWHWESTVFAIVAFALLYWLLNKYAFGPLFNVMEKRRQRVLEELEKAEADRNEAQRLLAEQTEALQTARREADELIEKTRKTSSKQDDEIINPDKAEAARLIEGDGRDIESVNSKELANLCKQVC